MSIFIPNDTDKLIEEYPEFKFWDKGKDKFNNHLFIFAGDDFYFSLVAMERRPNSEGKMPSKYTTKYRVWHPDRKRFINILTYEPDNPNYASSICFGDSIRLRYGDGEYLSNPETDIIDNWDAKEYAEEDFTYIIFSFVKTFLNDFTKWKEITRER